MGHLDFLKKLFSVCSRVYKLASVKHGTTSQEGDHLITTKESHFLLSVHSITAVSSCVYKYVSMCIYVYMHALAYSIYIHIIYVCKYNWVTIAISWNKLLIFVDKLRRSKMFSLLSLTVFDALLSLRVDLFPRCIAFPCLKSSLPHFVGEIKIS